MGGLHETVLDTCDSATGWTVLGNDTVNLATTDRRVRGLKALEFDKTDGAANTKLAGAYKTVEFALDVVPPWYELVWYTYASALTDIDYAFVRLGTDASNYVEYRESVTSLIAGEFTLCRAQVHAYAALAGTGCDFSNIDYMVVGVAFHVESDALADIAVDHLAVVASAGDPVSRPDLNLVNLNAVSSATDGAGIATGGLGEKTVYVTVSANTGAVTVSIEHSPDRVAWYTLDTKTYTAVNLSDSWSYNSHFPFMRTTSSTHANATVKTTLTGRAA